MASSEETALRQLLGIPTKGTIGDLRKAYWKGVLSGSIGGGGGSGVNPDVQSALNQKANIASPTFTGTVGGVTKTMVGLGNVDNTSDASKPVSTAQATAINAKIGGDGTVLNVVKLTQAAYDALGSKVATTLYVIV